MLVDEVRHRDFGWTLLPWLFELPVGQSLRSLAVEALPGFFQGQRVSYSDQGEPELSAEERAWGLMHSSRYQAILERAYRRDYLSRFEGVGIDARVAWNA